MPKLSRRDFLKLGSVLSGALAATRLAPNLPWSIYDATPSSPNILVLVFDAMSATNLSLYGYGRRTTPNLERFAKQATVYNAHYSAANFTTPGTASLLTGLYPWTHRAINIAGLIERSRARNNLFRGIGKGYYRLAFAQNMLPNYFFSQFQHDLESVLSPAAFSLADQVLGDKFPADLVDTQRAFDDFLFRPGRPPASVLFGLAGRFLLRRAVARGQQAEYPRGLPHIENGWIYFRLEDVFDGLMATVERLPQPSIAYLHLWSPHAPYRPSLDFESLFTDGWRPSPKPDHILGDHVSPADLNANRHSYDRYIANLDAEFGRLLDFLEAKRILERSYLVVTSDHGEMFERGLVGHITPLLYDPVVRVPLLVSSPGQTARRDVSVPTTSVDVVPTLVHLSGGEIPDWCEGQVLPALGGADDPERSIFMMDTKQNSSFAPLTRGSFAMRKGKHKLIYYMRFSQYGNEDTFELYDLENDPEELNDLYIENSILARSLRDELLAKVQSAAREVGN